MQRLTGRTCSGLRRVAMVQGGVLAAVAAAALVGCGGSEARGPVGKVSGKVTSGSGPVSEVSVQFFAADGTPAGGAVVDASGEFRLAQPLPVGSYTASVFPAVKDTSAESPALAQALKKIPPKYRDPKTSGFTAEVKEGNNSFTFEIR